jgi:thiol-disulfide isomerase/thioredoxin
MKKLLSVAVAAFALGSTACTSEITPEEEFEDRGQKASDTPEDYPGPYAYEYFDGAVMPPYRFLAYPDILNPEVGVRVVDLREFHNPDGAGVFSSRTPWEGQAKPKALVMMMSASWCPPCRQEASTMVPEEFPQRRPDVMVLSVLVEGRRQGDPPLMEDLFKWAENYQLNLADDLGGIGYPQAIDPEGKVTQHYEPAFPGNLIVRTSDMRMVFRQTGLEDPPTRFMNAVDEVVAGER